MSNDTMLGILGKKAESIRTQGNRLLKDFSSIHEAEENEPDDMIFIPSWGYWWNPLSDEGKRLQVALVRELATFCALVNVLIGDLPESVRKNCKERQNTLRKAVEQDERTWWRNLGEAADGFGKAVDEILKILSDYLGGGTGIALAIPDTSALIENPDLESWRFDGIPCFEFILTPTVLGELDDHKVNHKNQEVRDKAKQLIKRIKEYRRRGSLHDGVPLVNGVVSLRCVAIEPDMKQSLSWFDALNADDRFLASSLQIIRENMGHNVFIVTCDINMQNKAEFAGIPFCEVP